MNLSYNLAHPIQVDKLIKDITKLCSKVSPDQASSTMLVISLSKVIEYNYDSPLPKLEYKPHD